MRGRAPFRIQVLPTPRGQDGPGDGDVALPHGKPYAVLCLVGLEPTAVTRDDLAALLWPDASADRARASVRQALYSVRKAIGADVLIERDGALHLDRAAVAFDLDELDQALSRGDAAAAHAMWNGGPFAHFSLADAPAFNTWADRIREQYERRLGTALRDRGLAARERGDLKGALEWLAHALDVRPYDEAAHGARIHSFLDLGRLEEASQALDQARTLADEPSPELLQQLRDRLDTLRRAQVADIETGEDELVLQFVGRTHEFAKLRSLWATVRTGRTAAAAMLGDAGAGKTRLAEEFIRNAVGPDACVVRAKASPSERTLDLGLVADLVRGLSVQPGAAGVSNTSFGVLRQLVPSLGNGSGAAWVGQPSGASLADAFIDLVEAVAGECPLVLLADDLQWADAESRTLLLRAIRSLRAVPVLTLITCRSGDADLSALRVLREEAGQLHLTLFELSPLTSEEVEELIGLTARVEPEGETESVVRLLYATTGGNPLFVTELLRELQADGVLIRDGDGWVLPASAMPTDLRLPGSVRELLESRLSGLGHDAKRLLAALANAGNSRIGEVVRLSGLHEAEATRAFTEALQKGLVRWTDGDSVGFTHDTLAEVARSVLPRPRGASRNARRRTWAIGAVAAAGLVAIFLAILRPAAHTAARYGGGTLYVEGDGVVRSFRLPPVGSSNWEVQATDSLPPGVSKILVAQPPEGGTKVFGQTYTADQVPVAVAVDDGDSVRPLLTQEGDVVLRAVSPDVRYALLSAAEENVGHWHQNVVRLDLRSGSTKLLYSAPGFAEAVWFGDGSAVMVAAMGAVDSLILMRPDGRRIGQMQMPGPGETTPFLRCGIDGRKVVRPLPHPGRLASILLLDIASGGTRDVQPAAPLARSFVTCSPDGGAVAYPATVGSATRLVIQDLASGDTLVAPDVPDLGYTFTWLPDKPPAVPTDLAASPDTLRIRWGESARVRGDVRFSDGRVIADTLVTWTSLDPDVAYVTADGLVSANRGGVAKLQASVHGWIADTLTVEVDGSTVPEQALLSDPFVHFDTTTWRVLGSPAPVLTQLADGPALDLRGDGVGLDGIISRHRFDLSSGATLELSYRLPIRLRRDRQSIQVCLAQVRDRDREVGLEEAVDRELDRVCFVHPSGELDLFDSTSFSFSSKQALAGRQSRPDMFPSNDWRHLVIILAPDGNCRLLIDNVELAPLPAPVRMDPALRWVVLITGRAADTQLLVRDLLLWQGMRY